MASFKAKFQYFRSYLRKTTGGPLPPPAGRGLMTSFTKNQRWVIPLTSFALPFAETKSSSPMRLRHSVFAVGDRAVHVHSARAAPSGRPISVSVTALSVVGRCPGCVCTGSCGRPGMFVCWPLGWWPLKGVCSACVLKERSRGSPKWHRCCTTVRSELANANYST